MSEKLRETGISKVIGLPPEEEKAVFEYYNIPIEFKEGDKTEEEKEVVSQILNLMPDFIRRYGGVPVDIKQEQIYFLENSDSLKKQMTGGYESEGFYSQAKQMAVIFKSKGILDDSHKLVHELLHFNSFQSLEGKEKNKMKQRRFGFTIKNKENDFLFENIDEAVIEKLAVRFDRESFAKIPQISKLTEERNNMIASLVEQYPESKEFIENASSIALNGEDFEVASSRHEEIEILDEIIKEIYMGNRENFESEDDIFNLFAKAVMSGELLPVARLIEKTYGKGSFRKLGQETK